MHKRKIELNGGTARIELTKGHWAIVDSEDVDKLAQYTWCFSSKGYAKSRVNCRMVWMHRFILGLEDRSLVVDHINGDKLDNRKSNLRITSQLVNSRNSRRKASTRQRMRGLGFRPSQSKPYHLHPTVGNRRISLGCYSNTSVPALLFDAVQVKIAKTLDIEISDRCLNYPEQLEQTLELGDLWLTSILTDKQLKRLEEVISNLVKQHSNETTYIYLAKQESGLVKIGFSRSPEVRVSDIRKGHCLGSCKTTQLIDKFAFSNTAKAAEVEKYLHEKYATYRAIGEWFEFDDSTLAELIQELTQLSSQSDS